MRIEPAPSEAEASGTRPAATAAALPPLEPPVPRWGFQGLRVTPQVADSVKPKIASSGRLVLPTTIAPAPRSRCTISESAVGRLGEGVGAVRGQLAGEVGGVLERDRDAEQRPLVAAPQPRLRLLRPRPAPARRARPGRCSAAARAARSGRAPPAPARSARPRRTRTISACRAALSECQLVAHGRRSIWRGPVARLARSAMSSKAGRSRLWVRESSRRRHSAARCCLRSRTRGAAYSGDDPVEEYGEQPLHRPGAQGAALPEPADVEAAATSSSPLAQRPATAARDQQHQQRRLRAARDPRHPHPRHPADAGQPAHPPARRRQAVGPHRGPARLLPDPRPVPLLEVPRRGPLRDLDRRRAGQAAAAGPHRAEVLLLPARPLPDQAVGPLAGPPRLPGLQPGPRQDVRSCSGPRSAGRTSTPPTTTSSTSTSAACAAATPST